MEMTQLFLEEHQFLPIGTKIQASSNAIGIITHYEIHALLNEWVGYIDMGDDCITFDYPRNFKKVD